MIIVMMKTITLIAIGMMVLVVIIMPLNGIFFVLLVNVLIPMLVLQLVKTNGRPKNASRKRTKTNVTRKRSRQIVKKHADTVKQDQCFNLPFARMSIF